MSIANFLETKLLDLVFNGVSYAGQSTVYVKLHTGDPGEDGTANAATNTTRQAVTFAAASGGAVANDSAPAWTSVPASEDYTHASLWDASSGGNCLWTGVITANPVTTGDTFDLPVGDIVVALD